MQHTSSDRAKRAEIEKLKAGYSSGQRMLEIAGIGTFFAATVLILLRLAHHLADHDIPRLALILGSAILLSLLFADFVSGLVHWAADNWGSPEWPILGTGFIRPFRHHHLDPEEMTRHDFVELNGNNCIISLPVLWWAHKTVDVYGPAEGLFWCAFWLLTAYWVFGTNQFHAWAHTKDAPRLVSLLQRLRLILPKQHHHVHHIAPHARNYCITNGWLNTPLRAIRFFEILEWTMTTVTGIRPQHDHIEEEMRTTRDADVVKA
jgi:ubiquitin-conjugating enzyme E2 variant